MRTMSTIAVLALAAACTGDALPPSGPDLVARGKHLVTTSGCHDCHTPLKMGASGPEPDFSRELSGHPADLVMPPPPSLPPGPWATTVSATLTAWAGPWGVSYTANLTPDRETGIGTWTRQTFIDTIRNGRHMGVGRPLLPPMPFPMYRHMTDDELGAVFAYLQSIPAVRNRVPDPVLPPQAAAPVQEDGKLARR